MTGRQQARTKRIQEAGAQEDQGLRARAGARAHQQRGVGPLHRPRNRGQEPLVLDRGRAGRPRPAKGRCRGTSPRGGSARARARAEGARDSRRPAAAGPAREPRAQRARPRAVAASALRRLQPEAAPVRRAVRDSSRAAPRRRSPNGPPAGGSPEPGLPPLLRRTRAGTPDARSAPAARKLRQPAPASSQRRGCRACRPHLRRRLTSRAPQAPPWHVPRRPAPGSSALPADQAAGLRQHRREGARRRRPSDESLGAPDPASSRPTPVVFWKADPTAPRAPRRCGSEACSRRRPGERRPPSGGCAQRWPGGGGRPAAAAASVAVRWRRRLQRPSRRAARGLAAGRRAEAGRLRGGPEGAAGTSKSSSPLS